MRQQRGARMSRAVRTTRGAAAAMIATVFAASSHALGGGSITPLAVLATAVLALPVCVALAGRLGSLWRLSAAVVTSQFLYHWSFAGLGIASARGTDFAGAAVTMEPVGPHAVHLAGSAFSPLLASALAGSASAWMWASHALAAVITISLVYRGERAALAILALLRRLLPIGQIRVADSAREPAVAHHDASPILCESLALLSPISHRGPPREPAFA